MWSENDKTQFLIYAFQALHQNNKAIRDRLHANMRNSVALCIFVSGFVVTNPDMIASKEFAGYAALGIGLLAILSSLVIWRQFRTLMTQHEILANIEKAMGFHNIGEYLKDRNLYPESASIERLTNEAYYKQAKVMYHLIVLGSGLFTIFVLYMAARDIPVAP